MQNTQYMDYLAFDRISHDIRRSDNDKLPCSFYPSGPSYFLVLQKDFNLTLYFITHMDGG